MLKFLPQTESVLVLDKPMYLQTQGEGGHLKTFEGWEILALPLPSILSEEDVLRLAEMCAVYLDLGR